MEDLSTSASENLEKIINDLEIIFDKKRIELDELEEIEDNLQSDEVENYLRDLRKGSKPETALREELLAGSSTLANYFFGRQKEPEVNTSNGFIDYKTKADNVPILIELKPLFTPVYREESGKTVLRYLKESTLDWKDHREQIEKYLRKNEFLILTNLKHWFFFSKRAREPITEKRVAFKEFNDDFKRIENLRDFLERFEESKTIRGDLDKHFFNNLDNWVSALDSVDYRKEISEEEKIEAIIKLINKFIFIQTLDDHFVIDFHWIRDSWKQKESKWQQMGEKKILSEFLEEINDWFYAHYDTELFRMEDGEGILQLLENNGDNISKFYRKLKRVLGLEHWQRVTSARGIVNYNYRQIDEDIFGKAYETYLAEVRKEQGIYYTPKYITQYIVEETVGKKFDEHLDNINDALDKGKYDKARNELEELVDIKVLDPACGSGSFLIKAVRIIWNKYTELLDRLKKMKSQVSKGRDTLEVSQDEKELKREIGKLYDILGYRPRAGKNRRILMSKLILRHIYGNDLDPKALSVAKVNIWLSAIKLIPKEYRYERISEGSGYSLPDLEVNLGRGDSLVSLPQGKVKEYLENNKGQKITELTNLRNSYLDNPQVEEPVEEIKENISNIKDDLGTQFKKQVEEQNLPDKVRNSTSPFYWSLQFWHVFEGKAPGFDIIVGNPPYFTIRGKGTGTLTQTLYYPYLKNSTEWSQHFRSHSDIYYYFIMRSIDLLSGKGSLGFIIESYWLEDDYADRLKEVILNEVKLEKLIHFGDIKIFEDAGNDTCVLAFQKEESEVKRNNNFLKVVDCKKTFPGDSLYNQNKQLMKHIRKNISNTQYSDKHINVFEVEQNSLGEGKWVLSTKNEILEKLKKDGVDIFPLGDLTDNKRDKYENEFDGGKEAQEGISKIGQGIVPGRKKLFCFSQDKNTDFGGFLISEGEKSFKIKNKKNNKTYNVSKEVIRIFLTNQDIERYGSLETEKYILYPLLIQVAGKSKENYPQLMNYLEAYKKELEERYDSEERKYPWYGYQRVQNVKKWQANKKIVCPYRAKENSFTLDTNKHFATTDAYAIVPKKDTEKELNTYYLLGILNSKLLNFWYQEAGKEKGRMFEYFATPLKRIPIRVSDQNLQKSITRLVKRMLLLKNTRRKVRDLVDEYAEKLKSTEKTLSETLESDKRKARSSKLDSMWTSDVSFYPGVKNKKLDQEFEEFSIVVSVQDSKLKIYGLTGTEQSLLYEMKFDNLALLDLTYVSIENLLRGKRRVNSLEDIFSKTSIPVIRPNINEKTPNIMENVNRDFEEWKKVKDVDKKLRPSLAKNDQEIQKIDNKIDALVFNLYSLNRREIRTVLDSLNTTESLANDILEKFDNLG